jgi:ATP-binding cassette subfamily B protein
VRRAFAALRLVIGMSVRVSPWQSLLCLAEAASKALNAVQPVFFAWFATGAIAGNGRRMGEAIAGLVVIVAIGGIMGMVGNGARLQQAEYVGFEFDAQMAEITSRIDTLDHLETPEYVDRLQILRDNAGAFGASFNSLLNVLNNLAWSIGSLIVALSTDWRLLLLALLGVPRLVAARWTQRWQRQAEEAAGEPSRLVGELLALSHGRAAAAEIRVFGLQAELRSRIGTATRNWRSPDLLLAKRMSLLETANAALFFGGTVAVLGWMTHDVLNGSESVGALAVGITAAGSLQQVAQFLVGGFQMFGRMLRTVDRFRWLQDYADSVAVRHKHDIAPPERLTAGIRFEGVHYRYPGADRDSLQDIDLELPPGTVIAVVGENGAGKSTLVKLLTGMYDPSGGRITVEGIDLSDIDLAAWRARVTGAFQDHANLELVARESIGAGDLLHVRDDVRVTQALRDAAADDVLTALPRGLDTQLGSTWPDGVDLSGGQWQRLAIARAMMRTEPLLLVLDEPTSALDAATEHALFERYTEAAKTAGGQSAITILVTHRFSTVAAADLVVVLDSGRIAEIGTHAELIAAAGPYAELYELQARGYR